MSRNPRSSSWTRRQQVIAAWTHLVAHQDGECGVPAALKLRLRVEPSRILALEARVPNRMDDTGRNAVMSFALHEKKTSTSTPGPGVEDSRSLLWRATVPGLEHSPTGEGHGDATYARTGVAAMPRRIPSCFRGTYEDVQASGDRQDALVYWLRAHIPLSTAPGRERREHHRANPSVRRNTSCLFRREHHISTH